jgi:hypothetical protein
MIAYKVGTPTSNPDITFVKSDSYMRWVLRAVPISIPDSNGSYYSETFMFLQEKHLDGWGNPVWLDVPIVEEEVIYHNKALFKGDK